MEDKQQGRWRMSYQAFEMSLHSIHPATRTDFMTGGDEKRRSQRSDTESSEGRNSARWSKKESEESQSDVIRYLVL